MRLKRTFLILVITAFSLAAALGVWVLLFETFFGVEDEIFATLGSLMLFSLPALASAANLEKKHWLIVSIADIALCVFGLIIYLLAIWLFMWWRLPDPWDEVYGVTMGVTACWAVALPWAALLGRPSLRRWMRWVQFAAIAITLLTALYTTGMIITLVWFDRFVDEEILFRLFGVFLILTALGAITVPILYKVQGIDKITDVESTALTLKLTCPRCTLEQVVADGVSRCRQCRLKFHIEIEEPRCPCCHYLLHQLTRPICPECGLSLGADEVSAESPADPPVSA